jgi:predicted DNA repair protein MutK
MPASSLLVLIDDIATVLDDVSVMTKVAAKKTAGVLGDDLALNAQQVTGVRADRELPVVWAVAKGSLLNKLILVPAALAISALAPWLVTPLLMVGGAFLCFEGFEKVAHKWLHRPEEDAAAHARLAQAVGDPAVDRVTAERDKIKGAVRTDFVLSAEIIAITLGVVALQPLVQQVAVLGGIALLMTIGVYGLVAGIVKLDDLGLHLASLPPGAMAARARQAVGRGILRAAPWLMKGLSIAGTVAMFLVGGGILTHGWPAAHHAIAQATTAVATAAGGLSAMLASWVPAIAPLVGDLLFGLVAGGLIVGVVSAGRRMFGATPKAA